MSWKEEDWWMQFCWKMLSGWEQGWLNTPLSFLDKKWGITGISPAQLSGSPAPRSILLLCTKQKSFRYLLSVLLFVHLAVFIIQCLLSSPCPLGQWLRRCWCCCWLWHLEVGLRASCWCARNISVVTEPQCPVTKIPIVPCSHLKSPLNL